MPILTTEYIFTFKNQTRETFVIKVDDETLQLVNATERRPPWTALPFRQCAHCPLEAAAHPHCPAALHLVNIVHGFESLTSHDELEVEIRTEERIIFQKTTAQRGIGSMMGLVLATSGCPHTAFFRPMARFHLPLASEEETIYRASSMYFLAQYFRYQCHEKIDLELEGLTEIYRNIQIVNKTIAERIRAATETDSSINAVIFLDMYAKAMPYVIRDALEEIRHLFRPYLPPKCRSPGR
jgi:hypothetical protein